MDITWDFYSHILGSIPSEGAKYTSVAQRLEQTTYIRPVGGSIPSRGTIISVKLRLEEHFDLPRAQSLIEINNNRF